MIACLHALRRVLWAVLLVASTVAAGDSGDPRTRWACWYDAGELVLRCVLDRAPSGGRPGEPEIAVDSRLPEVVQTIRRRPDLLAESLVNIPLWNVPYDFAFAANLADSVMCGTRPDCTVVFDANADGRAPARVAALRAGGSEEQVLAEMARQDIALLASAEYEPAAERKTRRRARLNG